MAPHAQIDLFAARGKHKNYGSIADKIDASGDCWEWIAYKDKHGYGAVLIDGRPRLAHRIVWEALVGTIPDGMQIDHLCRNTSCVNPDHLEPVTPYENFARGQAPAARNARKRLCNRGHLLVGDNLSIEGSRRRCLACRRLNCGSA